MTAYFIRRFLLIVPTFIGIPVAVLVVMQLVPRPAPTSNRAEPRWMRAGDTAQCRIEGIGVQKHSVVAESPSTN